MIACHLAHSAGFALRMPVGFLAAVILSLLVAACEKVPLLAPSGSAITLTASTNALASNGSTDIIAQVLEASGTLPHSGTHVRFTTTLGTIEPTEPVTNVSGRVVVKFLAGGVHGTETITTSSGGASTGTDGAVTIAVGSAAVGRITLTANPTTISANGRLSAVTANVVDINGNSLPLVPVSFATSAGVLSSAVVNTDAIGVAQTIFSTSVQATVTGTVGVSAGTGTDGGIGGDAGTDGSTSGQASATVTVNVDPLPTVSISAPGGTLTAGSPIVFTMVIAPGTNSTA